MPKISTEKVQLRRKEILDKAFEVFSLKGYSQATMDDIVKHSGISKGGLYIYFKSKEEIFLAIAEERFQLRSNYIKELDNVESASKKVELYIRWFLESLKNDSIRMVIRFTTEFWSVMSRNTSNTEIGLTRYTKFEKDLEALLLEGIKKGEFRNDLDTKSMVYIILSSLDGIGSVDAVMGIKIWEAVIDNYINMILKYLKEF